jgi:hypothetical protein
MTEFRVYLRNQCLINPPPPVAEKAAVGVGGALLGLFVPKLIETAITGIANALKKAGDDETEQMTAENFTDLYVADAQQALSVNPALGCVLGVWFELDKDSPPDDDVARTLKAASLVPAKAAVGGVFEASIRPTSDATAFFLDTRHFSVRDFIGSRRKDERSYVVTLTLSTPSATAEGNAFALGKISLGHRKRGDTLIPMGHALDAFPRYRSNLMPWSKISETSKASYDRDVNAKKASGRGYMPVTFSLTISETADGNKFLFKLGELLGGLADKAAAEISKQILPAEREKAAADEAARAEKLYEEELKAELAVRRAQKAYNEGLEADKPILKVELELAIRKLAWQTSLREAAGLPARDPVPES